MALHDWDVVGQDGDWVALRRINGQEVSIKAGVYGTLAVAVSVYEAREQQRMRSRVIDLGNLVDEALDRLMGRQRQ